MNELIALVVGVVFVIILERIIMVRTTVYEYEKGLRFRRGRYSGVVDAGVYWYLKSFTTIQKIDLRPQIVSIPGQEVLSSDSVSIKVSIVAQFQIFDPYLAVTKSTAYRESLYTVLQISLREIVGASPIDTLLEGRQGISRQLFELSNAKVAEFGLQLISADIKDIMFPGELKKMFAQIVKAKKEGLAALEKARGESASLRHLANAARMLDNNPNLLQLRIVQALSESTGNTVVLNTSPSSTFVPIKGRSTDAPLNVADDTRE